MRHWQSPRRIGGRLDHGLYWIVLARGKSVAVVRNVVVIWSNFKLTSRCSRPHLYAPNIKLPDILIIRLTICLSSVTCGAQAVTRHIIDEFPLAAQVGHSIIDLRCQNATTILPYTVIIDRTHVSP